MVQRFLAATALLAGLWTPASAQVRVLDQLRGMAGAEAAPVAAPASSADPASQPVAVSPAELTLERIRQTMQAGMSPERRAFMDAHVFTAILPPGMNILDKVVDTMKGVYPPADAAPRIAAIKQAYSERADSGPVERVPQIPRGLTQDFDIGDGLIMCFVGEENLVGPGDWDPNGSRRWRVAVHELGHAVHRTFTDKEWAMLKKIAKDFYSDKPDPKDRYQEGDEKEMFAEFTEIWFGVYQSDLNKKGWDVDEVPAKFAPLKAFLQKVYGPARKVRP